MKRPYNIEYATVRASYMGEGSQALEARVNAKIKEGWDLIGGVAVDGGVLYQAMVKVEPIPVETVETGDGTDVEI